MIELSNCLWVPVSHYSPTELVKLRKKLTVKVVQLDGSELVVECLREGIRPGYVGLPRVYGLQLISNQQYRDCTSPGLPARFPHTVALRDYQIPVVSSILAACSHRTDFIVRAATGKGKTVMGLSVIQQRGVAAAIIVDQENLLEQWQERIAQHLRLSPEEVGIVQGPRCDYKNKKIVICMIQTLVRREMPDAFYSRFGTVIFDESHTVGARTFSQALLMFPSEVRFGLSATPDRRDAFQKLIEWNLGTVDVQLDAEPEPSSVYLLESHGTYSWSANNSKMASRFISELANDGARNLTIAKATQWLYDSGRDVLVVSDRVEQLCSLMALCKALGMPAAEMGIYAKVRTVWVYEKDPRPARRPPGWEKGTEYTPIRLALVQKTIRKTDREFVKENSRVIFATYGIIAKGVDIPRLSGGVDATPRPQATQVLGRTLRVQPGKVRPIWVTLADVNSFRSLYQLLGRLTDYLTSNAEIFLWDFKKGRKPQDAASLRRELADEIQLLRRSKIVTGLDGNNTLLTPSTPIGKSN